MNKKLIYWIPAISYMGFIFYLSSKSVVPGPSIPIPYYDKVMHFIIFAILSALFLLALRKNEFKKPVLFAILFTIIYAATDEFHQFFVPGRNMDFFDWIADSFGSFVVLIFKKIFKY